MLNALITLTGQKVIFPFYHIVSDDTPVHIRNLYRAKNQKEFIADLDFMLQYYEPMDLSDVKSYLNQDKKRKKPGFYLSFDDGLSEMYHVVGPILLQKGIPAAFFCNTGFIDNAEMFYRYKVSLLIEKLHNLDTSQIQKTQELLQTHDIKSHLLNLRYKDLIKINHLANMFEVSFDDYLKEKQPYMSKAQLVEMKKDGFDIGAHSVDHPLFEDIELKEQIFQTQESLSIIAQITDTKDRIFAFPFTEYGVSSSFFKNVQADIIFGTAGLKKDHLPHVIHRIPMEAENQPAISVIRNQYLYYIAKSFLNKNVRNR